MIFSVSTLPKYELKAPSGIDMGSSEPSFSSFRFLHPIRQLPPKLLSDGKSRTVSLLSQLDPKQ